MNAINMHIDDFFKPIKLNSFPTDIEYRIAEWIIQAADAFARTTYQSIYIIDYYRKGFYYVSENPLFLCGETARNVRKMGYEFYQKFVPKSDLNLLLMINEAGFDFYYQLNPLERLKYTISYDFHLQQPNKKLLLINHKLTPLILDKNDNIWLALCVVSRSSNKQSGNILISKKGGNKSFQFEIQEQKWIEQDKISLTKQEKLVLTLSLQGYTIMQMAEKIEISAATVKFHKKNIFNKFKVKNIAEAISFATNNNLL